MIAWILKKINEILEAQNSDSFFNYIFGYKNIELLFF